MKVSYEEEVICLLQSVWIADLLRFSINILDYTIFMIQSLTRRRYIILEQLFNLL